MQVSVRNLKMKDVFFYCQFFKSYLNAYSENTQINLFIPIEFLNQETCPGLKKGGVLSLVRPEIELIVTAGDIPEKIQIDLAGLEVGDVITISSVELPEGSKPTIDRDFVIANIASPSGLRSSENEEGEEAEAAEAEAEAVAEE